MGLYFGTMSKINYPITQQQIDMLSLCLLKNPPIKLAGGLVALDEEALRRDVYTRRILCSLFGKAADSFHEGHLETYLQHVKQFSAPVIATPVTGVAGIKRLMAFQPRAYNTTDDLIDRITWEGLRLSFEKSGTPCQILPTNDDASCRMLWPRDPFFIVDKTAFFPDPQKMAEYLGLAHKDAHLMDGYRDTWQQSKAMLTRMGLKTVVVDNCYFEGGNLILDTIEGQLFCGERYEHRKENIQPLCNAIRFNTGHSFNPVYIPTDPMITPHLDLGMSPQLPNGKFIVSATLGPDRNCAGYREVTKYLGKDRIIVLPSSAETYGVLTTNIAVMGNGLMMANCPDALRLELEHQGMVVNAPTKEDVQGTVYELRGRYPVRVIGQGGPHCLTNEINCSL